MLNDMLMYIRAKEANVLIMNEVGLDPGIDHMSAMKIIDEARASGKKVCINLARWGQKILIRYGLLIRFDHLSPGVAGCLLLKHQTCLSATSLAGHLEEY